MSFLCGELVYTAIWIVLRVIVWSRQKKIDWKREAALMLMFINLAVIIRLVYFPLFSKAAADGLHTLGIGNALNVNIRSFSSEKFCCCSLFVFGKLAHFLYIRKNYPLYKLPIDVMR